MNSTQVWSVSNELDRTLSWEQGRPKVKATEAVALGLLSAKIYFSLNYKSKKALYTDKKKTHV